MKKKYFQIPSFLAIAGLVFLMSAFTFSPQTNVSPNTDETFKYRKLSNQAFSFNEKLTYRVHYGIINAAAVTMEVGQSYVDKNDRKCYHIKADGRTLKSFDWAYKVRDKFESYVDQEAIVPISYNKSVQEDKYTDNDLVTFKHNKKKLYGIKGVLDMPEYTHDIISALYYVRNIDFSKAKKGDNFPIDIYLDNKIYNLGFKYDGKETINTDIGKIKCLRFVPILVVDRVFKDQNDMTVWVSDDENKIPIRVKAKIMVGSVKVDITDYSHLKNPFSAKIK
ncbi:MAG: DUF3108 domain-containing protein [Bacteroidota bacterium]|nr:DUF3108 domain-containing protein [Bacteroidota bacterium]